MQNGFFAGLRVELVHRAVAARAPILGGAIQIALLIQHRRIPGIESVTPSHEVVEDAVVSGRRDFVDGAVAIGAALGRAVKIALLVENGSDIIGFKAVRGTGKDVENRLDVFLTTLADLENRSDAAPRSARAEDGSAIEAALVISQPSPRAPRVIRLALEAVQNRLFAGRRAHGPHRTVARGPALRGCAVE